MAVSPALDSASRASGGRSSRAPGLSCLRPVASAVLSVVRFSISRSVGDGLVERRPRCSMATNRAGDEPIQARAGNDRTFAGHDVQECQPVGLEIAARGSGQTDGAYDAAGPQASAAAKKIQTSILLARIDFTKTSTTRLR